MVFSALLALSAFIYGMVVVIRQRSAVRLALRHYAEETNSVIFAGALRVFSSIWHLLAIAYFLMLLVLNLLSGEKELPYVLRATSYTILWVCWRIIASALMTQYIHREIRFKRRPRGVYPDWQKAEFLCAIGIAFSAIRHDLAGMLQPAGCLERHRPECLGGITAWPVAGQQILEHLYHSGGGADYLADVGSIH